MLQASTEPKAIAVDIVVGKYVVHFGSRSFARSSCCFRMRFPVDHQLGTREVYVLLVVLLLLSAREGQDRASLVEARDQIHHSERSALSRHFSSKRRVCAGDCDY